MYIYMSVCQSSAGKGEGEGEGGGEKRREEKRRAEGNNDTYRSVLVRISGV